MDANEEIRYLMLAIQREGNRQFAEVLRPLDLTPSQAEVIRTLSEIQPVTLLGLGEHLVCETGSPSRLVNRMVQNGFVQKQTSAADGRAVVLSLTPKGEQALAQLDGIEAAMHAQIGKVVAASGVTREALLGLLWQFAEGTDAGNALQRRKEAGQS